MKQWHSRHWTLVNKGQRSLKEGREENIRPYKHCAQMFTTTLFVIAPNVHQKMNG